MALGGFSSRFVQALTHTSTGPRSNRATRHVTPSDFVTSGLLIRTRAPQNVAHSTHRDEYMAGSLRPVGSVRASTRKFLSCSASLFVEYTSAVLLNTSCPTAARTRKLRSNLPQFTWLCRPTVKSGLALPIM